MHHASSIAMLLPRIAGILKCLFVLQIFTDLSSAQITRRLGVNGQETIISPGFPDFCCRNVNHTLEAVSGFLRLVFTDLDLPKGSFLYLYDGPNENSKPFSYQPELYGKKTKDFDNLNWHREGIQSSGRFIHMKLVPPKKGYVQSEYSGFRAHVWSTNSPKDSWRDWPTSDLCPSILPAVLGGQLTLRPSQQPPAHHDVESTVLDCVWQIKKPIEAAPEWKVYARFTQISFDEAKMKEEDDDDDDDEVSDDDDEIEGENFSVEVLNKSTSLGATLLRYGRQNSERTVDAFSGQPRGGYMSTRGLYIRVQIPYTMTGYVIRFIYGTFMPKADCQQGPGGGGVLCPQLDLCVPGSHVCDDIPNCPDATDETQQRCLAKVPTTTSSSLIINKPTTTTTKAPWYCMNGKLCDNGECVRRYERCPVCPPKHAPSKKKECDGGVCVGEREMCPDEPCPSHKPWRCPSGSTSCIYDQYVCDGGCDCDGCGDEEDCSSDDGSNTTIILYIVLPIAAIILIGVLCGKCLSKKSNSNSNNTEEAHTRAEREGLRPAAAPTERGGRDYTGTRMQPVLAGSAPPRPQAANNTDTGETVIPLVPMSDDRENPSAPPPPSYDDVVNTNYYPNPSAPTEMPPPPAYDSVSHIAPKDV